jgi:O-antigen/teichoic acid export membrane protein
MGVSALTTAEPATSHDEVAILARGGIVGIVGTVLSQLSLFGVIAMLAGTSGTEDVGIYSEAFAIMTLLTIVVLVGFQTTLTRYVAEYLVAGETANIHSITRIGIRVSCSLAVVVACALEMWPGQIAGLLGHSPDLAVCVRWVGLTLVPAVYLKSSSAVIQGYNRLREVTLVTLIVEPGARVILSGLVFVIGGGVRACVAVMVISNLIAAIWSRRIMRQLLPVGTHAGSAVSVRRVLRFTLLTWSATMTTNGLVWGDTLLLAALSSDSDVGIYQVATRVVTLIASITVPIAAAFAPRVADLVRRQDWSRLESGYRVTTLWCLRLCLPFLAAVAVYPSETLRLFGAAFATGAAVSIVLTVGKLVDCGTGPCGVVLNMSSRAGTNALLNAAALGLNLGLNLWLIPRNGILGAAWAWTISLIVLNLGRVAFVKRLLRLSPWSRSLLVSLLAIAPCIGGAVALRFELSGLSLLLTGTILIIGLYAGLVWWAGLSEEDTVVLNSLLPGAGGARFSLPRYVARHVAPPKARRDLSHQRPLDIDTLVSPLRYDVLIRADFFGLVAEHLMIGGSSSALLEAARQHAYFVWFREIVWARSGRHRLVTTLDRAFAHRVDRSVALFSAIHLAGFDGRERITIKDAGVPRCADSGKPTHQRLFLADGCHRLALLMNSGQSVLEAGQYQIVRAHDHVPRDNTSRLLSHTSMSESEYAAFIGRGFGVKANRESALLSKVQGHAPERMDELIQVLTIDQAAKAQQPSRSSETLVCSAAMERHP